MFPMLFFCPACAGTLLDPLPAGINQKEGGGVLAKEKISDSLLDGFRTESNRKGKNGIGDVAAPV